VSNTLAETRTRPALRLSPTALSRYNTCPRAYRLIYVDRVQLPEKRGPALVVGSAIHLALKWFFGLSLENRSLEVLHQALRSAWAKERRPGTFSSREEEASYGREALDMLERFAKGHDLTVKPLARERWVSARLSNGASVYGKVDRLDSVPDGLELIDYKTGRRALEEDEIAGEPAAHVYTIAAEAETGRQVSAVRFIYLALGRDVFWRPEHEDVETARESLIELTDAIASDAEFPATPGDHCRICPYAFACGEADRTRLEDLDVPEAFPF